ncbi:3'(2'),5'-bisphosphate nucleotidase CysQ [Roseobacter sp.]|uniref:3'(2'),5'-bisphosphate nucleotidase CysQ n=1 Tax=Roseobacter sp. TaxID=1907202 RepID=UPI0025F94A56|nr:3'(2'),5'-bisphosphate nucleotidase CysQ [Roseobacter sp.]
MQETDLALLSDAVRLAARVATSYTGKSARFWDKPDGAGPVTEADLAVNACLEATLRLARPDYGWLSEESEDTADRLSRETVFIVDPIDGTRSFQEGSRTWAHSVAIAHQGRITAGAICLPQRDKLYTAAEGSGAFLNGTPLSASAGREITGCELLAARPTTDPGHWHEGVVPGFRRAYRPSLAYRLGLVGEGRFDGMLTFRPTWEWDIAAGAIIVAEAGGVCSDKSGAALRFNNERPLLNGVVAAGRDMHPGLITALRR